MSTKAKIRYREFYDVPRVFMVRHQGMQLLFDSRFNEATDEYSEAYEVFLLPSNISEETLSGSWESLTDLATKHLGTVPVSQVKFDPTMRREIDTEIIDSLMEQTGHE